MHTINQLTTAISQNNPAQTHTQLSTQNSVDSVMKQPTQQLQDAIEVTFTTWKRLFRTKMRDEDWMPDTAEIWAIALTDLRITGKELAVAQRKSMSLEWPPTAPADFLALGRTDAVHSDYPEARRAYEHATDYSGRLFDDRNNWKHVVIYETARRIGFTKLATSSELYTWSLWRDVYSKVCDEHKAGADFKLPIDKSKQLAYKHTPVQPGSETDKQITAKLAGLRRMAV